MGRKKSWGDAENKFILDNAPFMKDEELADALASTFNRKFTLHGVRKQRQKVGVLKEVGRGRCKVRPSQSNPVNESIGIAVNRDAYGGGIDTSRSDGDNVIGIAIQRNESGGPFLFSP